MGGFYQATERVKQKETEGTKRYQEREERVEPTASSPDGQGCTTTRGAVGDKIDLQVKMDRLLAFLRQFEGKAEF